MSAGDVSIYHRGTTFLQHPYAVLLPPRSPTTLSTLRLPGNLPRVPAANTRHLLDQPTPISSDKRIIKSSPPFLSLFLSLRSRVRSFLSFPFRNIEICRFRYYENGATLLEDVPLYGKRLTNPWSHHHPPQQQPSAESSSPYCWYHPLHSSGSIQGLGHRHAHAHGHSHGQTHGHAHGHGQGEGSSSIPPPGSVQMSQMNAFSGSHHLARQQQQQMGHVQAQNGSLDDEWKNIHMMLNCILGMVEKTKKALAILQTRGCFGATASVGPPLSATSTVPAQNGGTGSAANNNPSSTNGSQVESSTGDREGSLKRLSGEIVAQTIRAIEDKVAEVKRKDGSYREFITHVHTRARACALLRFLFVQKKP